MYFLSASFSNTSSLFVSVNSTNEYVATASNDGNIKVRKMSQFTDLIPESREGTPRKGQNGVVDLDEGSAGMDTDHAGTDRAGSDRAGAGKGSADRAGSLPTLPLRQVDEAPPVDKQRLELAQRPVNIVGVRSRSKVTSLKYAKLRSHWNLLAAVYKNGEVYIIKDPQDSRKCTVRQIFKHANGLLLDFSWSADDQLLAFCSMNNEVIIYDVVYSRVIEVLRIHNDVDGKRRGGRAGSHRAGSHRAGSNRADSASRSHTPDVTKISTESTGSSPASPASPSGSGFGGSGAGSSGSAVKGICFDNSCARYLLTLGDDKKVNILSYELVPDARKGRAFRYTIAQVFTHLISSSKLNKATIRKVSWTRDDRAICVPNTSKSKAAILSVLKSNNPARARWADWFVDRGRGFKATMTQFSPCSYRKQDVVDAHETSPFTYAVATASPDACVSVWRTSDSEPLFVADNLSARPIQDICWSRDGRLLFVTTAGGNLLIGVFGEAELGEVVPDAECAMADIERSASAAAPGILAEFSRWAAGGAGADVADNAGVPNAHAGAGNAHAGNAGSGSAVGAGSAAASVTAAGSNTGKTASKAGAVTGPNSSTTVATSTNHPFEPPSSSVPRAISHKVSHLSAVGGADEPPRKRRDVEQADFVGSVVINPQLSFSNVRIAVPHVRWHIRRAQPEDPRVWLEVRNGNGHESYPARVALYRGAPPGSATGTLPGGATATGQPSSSSSATPIQLFVDFLPRKVHIVTGSPSFWAVSTTDGQIITYTNSGRRVVPTIVLGVALSFLELKDQYLLAVTSSGQMYGWDLELKKALFKPSSLYPLLQPIYRGGSDQSRSEKQGFTFVNGEMITRSENLTMCSISSTGIPIVTLANGDGYLYNAGMGAWTLVSDSWWAFGSQYWNSARSATKKSENSLLNVLETHTNDEIIRRGRSQFFSKISKVMLMREGFENLETVISLNHLENKICLYEMLGDFSNFKTYLTIYVKRLGELNLKDRLIEVFQRLFVDMDDKICGSSKKSLLKDLIVSCSKQREVQRILVEYADSIDLLNE